MPSNYESNITNYIFEHPDLLINDKTKHLQLASLPQTNYSIVSTGIICRNKRYTEKDTKHPHREKDTIAKKGIQSTRCYHLHTRIEMKNCESPNDKSENDKDTTLRISSIVQCESFP